MTILLSIVGLVVLGLVCGAIAGAVLARPQAQRDLDELHEAFAEVERQVGLAVEPVVRRFAEQIAAWGEKWSKRFGARPK